MYTSVGPYFDDIAGRELNAWILGLVLGHDWLVDGAVESPSSSPATASRIQ
ncbi:MAG: hypothetical protein ACR2IV_15520 [Bryobacteraceae bacterium]